MNARPWRKRMVRTAAALSACLALYLLIEHVRGRMALGGRLAELKAAGEELSMAVLEPKRAAHDENSEPFLSQLTNTSYAAVTRWTNHPPMARFPKPGRALVAWQLKEWSSSRRVTNAWQEIGAQLEQAREALAAIHAAAERPFYDGGFDYRKGFVDFQMGPLVTIKKAAQTLAVAADYELARNRFDAAHAHVLDLAKLAASQKSEPLVISQLVRLACATIAFHSTWKLLQFPGGTDAQFSALQHAWEQGDFAGDMTRAFAVERALQHDFFEQILSSRAKLQLVVDQQADAIEPFKCFATEGPLLRWINVPLWRVAWARQDQLRVLNRWQILIDQSRLASTNSWSALQMQTTPTERSEIEVLLAPDPALAQPGWWQRFRYPFSTCPIALSDHTIGQALEAQAQQQLALTALAIQRYRLRTGTAPESLRQLIPTELQTLPRDPMDRTVLRYRAASGAEFILYSVGRDGRDDGGDPSPRAGVSRYRQIWDGRDAVWPSPAVPASAQEAMDWTRD